MLLAPRRVIARRPLWVSVTRNPVVRRVNKVAALSNMRRDSGWLSEVPRKRLPSAKSAPFLANASISTAMSGAQCCPSASNVTMTPAPSLSANSIPVWSPAPCPKLMGCRTTLPPASGGNGTCRVGRAIIDDEGAISSALDVGDDARDHRRLIVGGDDNAYSRRLRHHRSSRNEEKPTPDQHDADHKPYRNGSAKTRQPSAGVSANASARNG